MKKFISKNWNKMLLIIGVVLLGYILVYKFNAEKSVVSDYAKYGKDITYTSNGSLNSGDLANTISNKLSGVVAGIHPDFVRLTFFIIMAIIFIIFVYLLTNRAAAGKDGKAAKKK